ncbi:MAG TPA: cyclopropane-fatty-acyl-phospholipid synthase family protein [Stellaceae bacterium]|jgi:cyclopropane-fatty-acyl-phospholipid synthase|nr:cyclopropane-fatty-acyl-phospholipid synthase family protein [Stellaceae bacterium]
MSVAAAHPIVTRIERRLRGLDLPIRLCLFDGSVIDLGPAPRIALHFRRRGLVPKLLRGDVDGLAKAYVEGDLDVDGRIEDVIEIGIALAERLKKFGWLLSALKWLPRLQHAHSRAADAEWIRYHYDVSNEFFRLWLGRRMVYSCAYFEDGGEDIETAQEQKLDHICRKLRLRPGDRVLDVGCGWGGLLEFAAENYGVSGVGVTISRSQYDHARSRIAESGLDDRVEIRLEDYRDLSGEAEFDKIVSVGMYEHVGHANMPRYFETLHRLVKPNGVVLNHGITTTDPRGVACGPAGGGFLDRFVFPGGELPHIGQVVRHLSEQGFDVLDVESLRPHYAATLARWVARLEAEKPRAVELAGEARYRIWRVYMAGCALAFTRNWLSIYQVVCGKCASDGMLARPWTRRHIYDGDAAPEVARRATVGG